MPGKDRTGPEGKGPGTGNRNGYCKGLKKQSVDEEISPSRLRSYKHNKRKACSEISHNEESKK